MTLKTELRAIYCLARDTAYALILPATLIGIGLLPYALNSCESHQRTNKLEKIAQTQPSQINLSKNKNE